MAVIKLVVHREAGMTRLLCKNEVEAQSTVSTKHPIITRIRTGL